MFKHIYTIYSQFIQSMHLFLIQLYNKNYCDIQCQVLVKPHEMYIGNHSVGDNDVHIIGLF